MPRKKKQIPYPKDHLIEGCDVLLRVVPEVDNLFEVAIYLNEDQFRWAAKHMEKIDVNTLEFDFADRKIIRRGRKNKATNIFLYGER